MSGATRLRTAKRVALTRSEDKADDLRRALEALGVDVIVVPVIRHVAAGSKEELERVVRERLTYSHIAFTSQTAVQFFCAGSRHAGADAQAWRGVRIAAVGPQTAREIERNGLPVAVVGAGGGSSLARELLESEGIKRLKRVLIPQSTIARPELRAALEAEGVAVDVLPVYETQVEDAAAVEPFLVLLRQGQAPDLVYFASPSAVRGYLDLTGKVGKDLLTGARPRAVAIGATTAAALAGAGIAVAGETGTSSAEDSARRMAALLGR